MERRAGSERGFTLVELMIVVVIIGILASISIPKFSAVVARTKLTEVKNGIWHIVNMEKAYQHAYDEYAGFDYGENNPSLGYNQPSPGTSHFTYAFVVDDTSAYGKENGAGNDINFDGDGDDGLSISVTAREGIITGSAGDNFAW